jgi:tetratricopeptide (TPR) repeat protein
VVEGSVRRAGNRVRVGAQLIDAETMEHAWAEHYDRDLADVFELQDEVAHRIAITIAGRVKLARTDRAHRKPTESMSAYDNYLRALEWWGLYDRIEPAERFLLKAVEIDPRFALALARLSVVNMSQYFFDGDKSRLRKAESYGRQALALDDSEGVSHAAIALSLIYQRRFDEAAPHLERAIGLNSNDTFILTIRALWFLYRGQSVQALSVTEAAYRRDPFQQDWYLDVRGMAQTSAGLYAEALVSFRHMEKVPPWSYAYMAICHVGLGQLPEARAAAAQFVIQSSPATVTSLLDSDPYSDPTVVARFRAALLAAGVPEG